jgi:TRAP-type mannitol/chloroaromatic compound transport system substrate-binding protein
MGYNKTSLALAVIFLVSIMIGCATIPEGKIAPERAKSKFKLKFQATWPARMTPYENFTFFAERVKKMSGGRLIIETLPSGAVVPAFEVLDAVSKGILDGGHSWAAYWVGKDRTALLFTGGPGGTHGMDFVDAMGWLYEGGGLQLYREFYQKVLMMNVTVFPILPAGPQAFGWFKRPIKDLKDFAGMKCRETGMAADVFKRMGMTIVNMPGGEIIPAAKRGIIDCAEWLGGVEDLRLGMHNAWKYYYSPGMHENVTIGELLINGDVWKSLPSDLQAIVESAVTETFYRYWARWQRMNADAIKELTERHGVKIMKTPDDILIKFLETWDKLAAREAAKNPFFKKVLKSQRAWASVVVPAKRFYFPPYEFAADYYWPPKK